MRHNHHAWAHIAACEKIAKVPGHGILIVRNKDTTLLRTQAEHVRVGNAIQAGGGGRLKVDRWFAAEHARSDGVAEIVVGLEPRSHLVRGAGTEALSRRIQPLAQTVWKRFGRPSRLFETPMLAHTVGIDGRLVLQIIRDGAVDLSKVKTLKLAQN